VAPRWYAVVAWVFAGLFAVCVVLQFNDPDPVRWIALYGAAAVIAATLPLARAQPWARFAGFALAALAAAWAGYLLSRIWGVVSWADLSRDMMMMGGAVEEAREAGGLAIVAIALAALALVRRRWRAAA
jgi:hypothetical protein